MTTDHETGLWLASGANSAPGLDQLAQPGVLDQYKQELHRMSEATGVVNVLGEFRRLVPGTEQAEWTGSISLDRRLKSGELSQAELQEWLESVSDYYVSTSQGATIRCIDGRTGEGYDDSDPAKVAEALGAQVPGGSVGGAVAYRMSMDATLEDYRTADLSEDIARFAQANIDTGFLPGDHSDEHAPEGKMGCGAVDGAEPSQEKISHYRNITTIIGLTQALLGERYRPDHMKEVVANASYLLAAENYFGSIPERIEALKAHNPKGVPKLMGSHNEVIAIANEIPGTTLHRDHLNAVTDGKIQAFGFDIWYSKMVAEHIFPGQGEMQSRYIHSRIALAVATMMHLTDGTILFATRSAS